MRIKFRKLLKIRDVVFVDSYYESRLRSVVRWVCRPDGTMMAEYLYI